MASFSRPAPRPTRILSVYIEGDGASWPTPFHPPRDPTPRKPTAWLMAMEDAVPAVVYLGRPCQYLDAAELRLCNSRYWTERRFAPEVIDTYDEILDQLKSLYRFDKLRLIGYSGGGVIAALLAARRDDITSLVTVAAPLSLSDWVSVLGATPLTGSLDPTTLDSIHHPTESIHWVGEKDRIIPADVVKNFVDRQGGRMEVVPGFDHDCCWIRDWAIMLRRLSALESEK